METEEISETLVFNSKLTRLIARDDFGVMILVASYEQFIK
jgi:hypothetical protein